MNRLEALPYTALAIVRVCPRVLYMRPVNDEYIWSSFVRWHLDRLYMLTLSHYLTHGR